MRSTADPRTLLEAAAATHPGLERADNEDRYYCDPGGGVFLVVDGVGGQAAGERAAETALRMLRARLGRETGSPADRIREAITLANNEVYGLAQADSTLGGMACVLTAAIVRDGRVTVGHVGDTRLYTLRDGDVRKVTHDHSPVGEREDQGELPELEAMRHPRRHEIFRDVGSAFHNPADEEFIEVVELPFEPDSALLLCTDGLSDLVPSAALARIVYEHADSPSVAVERLIQAANEAGGKDNITVVLVEGNRFAGAARRARRAAAGRSASTGDTRGWLSAARRRAGAVATSRGVLFAAGCALGLALSYAALVWTDTVPGWLFDSARPQSWSRRWVVGSDREADFTTIGQALGRAQPGDTVEVGPGEYSEAVILRGNVTLVSQPPHEAIINAPDDAAPSWIAVEIRRGSRGRFAGFTIAGNGEHPLSVGVLAGDAEFQIEDLDVSGARVGGVIVEPRSRVVIRSSYIHDNPGGGVLIQPGALPRLLHNVISGNGRQPLRPGPGIEAHETARAVLFGNIIAGNAGEQIQGLSTARREEALRDNIVGLPSPRTDKPQSPKPRG
jgi:serine/threonine protein phosphatase PrpC